MSFYNGFIASLSKALITTKAEAAQFLAHAVWETVSSSSIVRGTVLKIDFGFRINPQLYSTLNSG